MKNLGILSLLLFVFISADVFAQEADLKKAKKEGRKELKEHYRTVMYPILKEQHSTFDAKLDASSLALLGELRAENNIIKADKKALKKEKKKMAKDGMDEEAIKAKTKPKQKAIRDRKKEIVAKLQPVKDTYADDIDRAIANLDKYKKGWKDERLKIRKKHGMKIKEKKEKSDDPKKVEARRNRKIAAFLLWDRQEPKAPKAQESEDDDAEEMEIFGGDED
ncbi:MAG: hypothetical protein MK212_04775 [Saprospiraceae bacterium]|nr:hypothetical protein [Saprospiraceae bacterium]